MLSTDDSRLNQAPAKACRGFTLIELLIVVAIILIIAAIAVPSLLRSKASANEASAVGDVRTVVTAAITYSSTYGDYPTTLPQLGGTGTLTASCDNAQLIDPVLSAGATSKKSGYSFTMLAGSVAGTAVPSACTIAEKSDGFGIDAEPSKIPTTGQRSFCSDNSGVIRQDITGTGFTLSSAQCSAGTGILGQ